MNRGLIVMKEVSVKKKYVIRIKKTIDGVYSVARFYQDNIVEIEFKEEMLTFNNIPLIDREIRRKFLKPLRDKSIPFTLVYNFKNVKYVDSCTIGLAIQSKNQMNKCHGEKSNIYYLNVDAKICKIYDPIGRNMPGFFVHCDSIVDVIKMAKGVGMFCQPSCEFLSMTEDEQKEQLDFRHHECNKYHKILIHNDSYPHIEKCIQCIADMESYKGELVAENTAMGYFGEKSKKTVDTESLKV